MTCLSPYNVSTASSYSAEAPLSKRLLFLLLSLCLSTFCHAQANDVAITVGAMSGPTNAFPIGVAACPINNPLQLCGSPTNTSTALTLEGTLSHRVLNLELVSLHLELPILGTPTRSLQQGLFRQDYSTIFFTPGLRVKFSLPVISPFASVGGGFAHFSGSNAPSSPANSNTAGAFEFGGGIDLKTPVPFIGLRGEAREFYTGTPGFSISSPNRFNLFVGGGIVLKF